jgi:hypothetical protein
MGKKPALVFFFFFGSSRPSENGTMGSHTYGVDLLETSFVICRKWQVSIQWLSSRIARTIGDEARRRRYAQK